jgi:hypothetical protein
MRIETSTFIWGDGGIFNPEAKTAVNGNGCDDIGMYGGRKPLYLIESMGVQQ